MKAKWSGRYTSVVGNTAARDTKRLQGAERRAQAAEMRTNGATLKQIADELGYSAPSNVRRDLRRLIAQVTRPAGEALRENLQNRLQKAYERAWPLTRHRDPKVALTAVRAVAQVLKGQAEIGGLRPPLVEVNIDTAAVQANVDVDAGLALLTPVELAITRFLQLAMTGQRPSFDTVRADLVDWLNANGGSPDLVQPIPVHHALPITKSLSNEASFRNALPLASANDDDF